MHQPLVSRADLARELGYSRQRVGTLIEKADDFPEPEAKLLNGMLLWRRDAALKWFKEHPRRPYRRTGDA
jgi:hypothetical protein